MTGNEYALLSAARLGLQSALAENQPNWVAAARNACLTATYGPSTALLAGEKASCLSSVALRVQLASFNSAENRCERRGSKRSVLCRAPLYRRMAGNAARVYAGDLKVHRAIDRRGFKGACAVVLGPTHRQLRRARRLVVSTRKLSGDWKLLVRVVNGQTRRRIRSSQIDRANAVVNHDLRLVLGDELPADLSSCPHPPA